MRDFDRLKRAQELKITIFPSCDELGSRVVSKESPKPKEPVSEASQYSDDDDWQFKPKETTQNSTESSEKISLIEAISALEKRFDSKNEEPKLQSEESEEPESEESKESSEEIADSEKSAKEISSETSEEVWIEKPSESSSYDVVVRDIQDILNLKNLQIR